MKHSLRIIFLEQADDVQMRACLIDRQIEDIRQTLFSVRRCLRNLRKEVHEIRGKNGDPTHIGSIQRNLLSQPFWTLTLRSALS